MGKNKIFLDADEIAELLGVSKATAYGIIKKLNNELDAKGFIVINGKVSIAYFNERWYGGTEIRMPS